MSSPKPKHKPDSQDQAQLQGQAQGQAQGQWQFALNDNKNDNDNDNKNENKSTNDSKNDLDNKVDNKLDNHADNDLQNKVDNRVNNDVKNEVENKVDTKVNVDVKVDLDLDLNHLAGHDNNDAIHIDQIKDIDGSVVMPDVVNQTLNGDGNQFNVQQINNLVDNDHLSHPEVKFDGSSWGGDFKIIAHADGGETKIDDVKAEIEGNGTIGAVTASADAVNTVDAFTQNIVMGANIQFNSMTNEVAGHDLTDDHHSI